MTKEEMLGAFQAEQGARFLFDHDPGSEEVQCKIQATDADAAVKGLALLAIHLAELMGTRAEHVIAKAAVETMALAASVKEEGGAAYEG